MSNYNAEEQYLTGEPIPLKKCTASDLENFDHVLLQDSNFESACISNLEQMQLKGNYRKTTTAMSPAL